MNRFNLQQQLASCYDGFPAEERPVIGITANYGEQTAKLAEGYYKQVVAAGGIPLIIPPLTSHPSLLTTLNRIDALLLTGGADINPLYQGEQPQPQLGGINDERDLPELLITRLAYNRQLPILGICRGIQTMAMALGGKVAQDIGSEKGIVKREEGIVKSEKFAAAIKHSQDADRHVPTHSINVEKDSTLCNIYSGSKLLTLHSSLYTLAVNSFHHQAVLEPGPHFRISATAPDGIIEAIESM